MHIEVNRDLDKFKESVVLGLSARQFIKCGTTIVPFDNRISKDSKLYDLYNTNIHEKIRKN